MYCRWFYCDWLNLENFILICIMEEFQPEYTLDFYDKLYKEFIEQYSPAYRQASDWYVGESLESWWLENILKEQDVDRLLYIYAILEDYNNKKKCLSILYVFFFNEQL